MSDYGWWGKSNYEPESEPPDKGGAYGRVMSAIYHKGRDAGQASMVGDAPQCPYKRKDFCNIWQIGFEDEVTKDIPEPEYDYYVEDEPDFDEAYRRDLERQSGEEWYSE